MCLFVLKIRPTWSFGGFRAPRLSPRPAPSAGKRNANASSTSRGFRWSPTSSLASRRGSSSGWIRARPFRSHPRAGRESRNALQASGGKLRDSRAGAGERGPVVGRNSLFPSSGKSAGYQPGGWAEQRVGTRREARIRTISLYFPCSTGKDGFAPDCPLRQAFREVRRLWALR